MRLCIAKFGNMVSGCLCARLSLSLGDRIWPIYSRRYQVHSRRGGGPGQTAGQELGIRTLGDMLSHYPFRYIDRTKIYRIAEISEGDSPLLQFRGRITGINYAGEGRKRRFTAEISDGTGRAELVWFQGSSGSRSGSRWGREYLVFGRPSFYKGELSMIHPEVETIEKAFSRKAESGLQGIYSSTERLSSLLGPRALHDHLQPLAAGPRPHPRDTPRFDAHAVRPHSPA